MAGGIVLAEIKVYRQQTDSRNESDVCDLMTWAVQTAKMSGGGVSGASTRFSFASYS